jgi:hypothetical protein
MFMSDQITTITFFQFKSLTSKFWAFSQMQFAHRDLVRVNGQSFYKLMGSGRGTGFSIWPDFSVYALLQVWENERAAKDFFEGESVIDDYRYKAEKVHTIFCRSITSHGYWNNHNPFVGNPSLSDSDSPILVLTRATIKWRHLHKFWKYVPTSYIPLAANQGLIYSKGVGEWPIMQMATISLWKSAEAMKQFAYKSKEHQQAIKMTKDIKWYKEELFARFKPFKTLGPDIF